MAHLNRNLQATLVDLLEHEAVIAGCNVGLIDHLMDTCGALGYDTIARVNAYGGGEF